MKPSFHTGAGEFVRDSSEQMAEASRESKKLAPMQYEALEREQAMLHSQTERHLAARAEGSLGRR